MRNIDPDSEENQLASADNEREVRNLQRMAAMTDDDQIHKLCFTGNRAYLQHDYAGFPIRRCKICNQPAPPVDYRVDSSNPDNEDDLRRSDAMKAQYQNREL